MRNRSIKLSKKLATIILCATMTCTAFTGCSMGNNDSKEDTKQETEAKTSETESDEEEETKTKIPAEGSGTAQKSETVYVTADATGKVKEITVSDWLKNKDNYETINDVTNLDDVKVIKGAEDLGQSGQDLTIPADGNDVYYRGTLPATTTLPVSVNIKYTLDDKEISAEEVEGATGHLGVHIEYTNNSTYTAKVDGKKKEIHVPFMAATMMVVPSDKINHAEIEHGKIVENGDTNVFLGYGFPGINESFGLEDGGIFTDTVDFEADVENFSSDMMMTFVTSEPFASDDLKDAVDFETVSDSIKEAADIEIKDVNDVHSIEDLESVVKKLNSSLNKLSKGAKKLNKGTNDLKKGTKDLQKGAKDLSKGAKDLQNGTKQLKNGSQKLAEGTKSLKTNYAVFNSKIAVMTDGMNDAYTGSKTITDGLKSAADGSKQLAAGAKDLSDGATKLAGGVSQIANGLSSKLNGLGNLTAPIDAAIKDTKAQQEKAKKAMAAAKQGSKEYMTAFAAYNRAEGAIKALESTKTQMAAAMKQANLTQTLDALTKASKELSDGATKLSAGATQFATKSNELSVGLGKLYAGSNKLTKGLAALPAGAKKLSGASNQINQGIGALYTGSNDLNTGVGKLYNGTGKLYKGTDKLYKGTGKLYDGAVKLHDGTNTLEKSTSKLGNGINGNLSPLVDTAKELKNAAKAYTTFTTLAEGGKGSVTFVIKTE